MRSVSRGFTRRRPAFWLGLLVALFVVAQVAPATADDGELSRKEEQALVEALPETYRAFLDEVQFIITDVERETFLQLEKEYQRDAFIEQFWRTRDLYSDTARNEYRQRYRQLLQEARILFDSVDDDRAKTLLLNGPPGARIEIRCTETWPAEVWFYPGTERIGHDFALVFYRRWGGAPYRLWRPSDGAADLIQFAGLYLSNANAVAEIRDSCRTEEADALIAAISFAFQFGEFSFEQLAERLAEPPKPPSEEWVQTFSSYTTDLPDDVGIFEASLEVAYPGRHQSRTVVQATLGIPGSEVEPESLEGHSGGYNFTVTGEVLSDGRLFDTFRYRFNLPEGDAPDATLPLVFERYLRPGRYRLLLKIEDLGSGKFARLEREIDVPSVGEAPPPLMDEETARILAEANAAISTGDDTVELVEPRGDYQTGYIRFNTLLTGSHTASVAFFLDGQERLRKKEPPYSVELDLGPLPRMRRLEAVAYDAQGEELDRDLLQLNSGSHRFGVRLVEPRRGQTYTDSLRAEAQVDLPEGETLERVEFYLNETLVATLYQEPFTQPIVLPEKEMVAYVRAVAYLVDGNSTEEIVFINSPDYMDEVDVQFVELYITVTDKGGHPVADLGVEEFTVYEDEVRQEVARFDKVTNLPVHVGILVDVSASMEEKLETAQRAAIGFLDEVITPRDRATLMTFNDHPNMLVRFTNDMGALASGLGGLKAERGTALYDALIFSLYYFNGVKGQRAIVLLSDGKDESSRFDFDQTLEYARRTGVAVYAIGLDLGRGDRVARKALSEISDETGGRSFFIDEPEELAAVYATIQEELRSRYYLAYQSNNETESSAFRTIEVEMGPNGLEAKTLRGYYP